MYYKSRSKIEIDEKEEFFRENNTNIVHYYTEDEWIIGSCLWEESEWVYRDVERKARIQVVQTTISRIEDAFW